jgi:hypothetical protein
MERMMSLHLVTWREELDQIEARFEVATTIEAYEQADAAFFAVDRETRARWLEARDPDLYAALQLPPDLHLL